MSSNTQTSYANTLADNREPKRARKIWNTPGGVHPPEHKEQSLQLPLAEMDIAAELIYPLSQHAGAPAEPIVSVGERVLTGQLIASSDKDISANIHAASSGVVKAIEARPLPHPSGLHGLSIVIATDGKDQWTTLESIADYNRCAPIDLLGKIKNAGVIGMGGAGFPTAIKLGPSLPITTLILNGTECEPYITADDILMRTNAEEIVAGAMLLSYILGKPKEILLAIEDNKPQAIESMRRAIAESESVRQRIEVVPIPTKYPSGGEKQLVQTLTGKEVPSGKLPAHVGVTCQNIATVVAAYRAVRYGEPLISRITTVTGAALEAQRNVKVRLGTPIHHVLRIHGYDATKASRLVMGGPMMGFTLLSDRAPVIKTTNCILAPSLQEAPPPPPAQACIRCGLCAEACPASLLPQQLYWYARAQEFDKLKTHNLFDCIECGACSYACPSHIPLVQYYRAAKGEIKKHEQEKIHSDHSRKRFEFHKERIEKEKQERVRAREEAAAKAKARKEAKAGESNAAPLSATIAPEATNNLAEQQAKIERTLISHREKLQKLHSLLPETEQHSPQKADILRAQIKGVEIKCQSLEKKLAELKQADTITNVEPDTTAQQTHLAVQPLPVQNANPAVLQLQQKIAETEDKLREAQQQNDAESVSAFNMSLNILRERLKVAAQDDNSAKASARPHEQSEVKSAIERAMERVLHAKEVSDVDNLRHHIDSLQERLQNAQSRLGDGEQGDHSYLTDLTRMVEQLETKLATAFEVLEEKAKQETDK